MEKTSENQEYKPIIISPIFDNILDNDHGISSINIDFVFLF